MPDRVPAPGGRVDTRTITREQLLTETEERLVPAHGVPGKPEDGWLLRCTTCGRTSSIAVSGLPDKPVRHEPDCVVPLILADIAALPEQPALDMLLAAIETMDQKITPYGEREDGTVPNYIVADSTWHRVLAAARDARLTSPTAEGES